MTADQLRPHAERLAELLSKACDRISIAGSIRREKPGEIKDIELCAVPKMIETPVGLFGDTESTSALDPLLERLSEEKVLPFQLNHLPPHNRLGDGAKMKRLVLSSIGYKVDLFLTCAESWGAIYTIRTGSREFSQWLMTNRGKGGAMPYGMRQAEGWLWRKTGGAFQHFPDGYQQVVTLEEQDYFNAIGVEWIPPQERTEHARPRLMQRSAV